jgi:hypothetical protein
MSRRVVLTCRSCKFIIATRARQAATFGWRFDSDPREALCPECVTPEGAAAPRAQVAPPLGLVRQSSDAWHGELLRLPPARFLRLERGPVSLRARVTAPGVADLRPSTETPE